jgi:hypothetical protein
MLFNGIHIYFIPTGKHYIVADDFPKEKLDALYAFGTFCDVLEDNWIKRFWISFRDIFFNVLRPLKSIIETPSVVYFDWYKSDPSLAPPPIAPLKDYLYEKKPITYKRFLSAVAMSPAQLQPAIPRFYFNFWVNRVLKPLSIDLKTQNYESCKLIVSPSLTKSLAVYPNFMFSPYYGDPSLYSFAGMRFEHPDEIYWIRLCWRTITDILRSDYTGPYNAGEYYNSCNGDYFAGFYKDRMLFDQNGKANEWYLFYIEKLRQIGQKELVEKINEEEVNIYHAQALRMLRANVLLTEFLMEYKPDDKQMWKVVSNHFNGDIKLLCDNPLLRQFVKEAEKELVNWGDLILRENSTVLFFSKNIPSQNKKILRQQDVIFFYENIMQHLRFYAVLTELLAKTLNRDGLREIFNNEVNSDLGLRTLSIWDANHWRHVFDFTEWQTRSTFWEYKTEQELTYYIFRALYKDKDTLLPCINLCKKER